jgi:hypothetical protein
MSWLNEGSRKGDGLILREVRRNDNSRPRSRRETQESESLPGC